MSSESESSGEVARVHFLTAMICAVTRLIVHTADQLWRGELPEARRKYHG